MADDFIRTFGDEEDGFGRMVMCGHFFGKQCPEHEEQAKGLDKQKGNVMDEPRTGEEDEEGGYDLESNVDDHAVIFVHTVSIAF